MIRSQHKFSYGIESREKMKLRLNLVKLLERSEIMRTETDANKIIQS